MEKMAELQFPFSPSVFHHAYPPGKYFHMFLSQHWKMPTTVSSDLNNHLLLSCRFLESVHMGLVLVPPANQLKLKFLCVFQIWASLFICQEIAAVQVGGTPPTNVLKNLSVPNGQEIKWTGGIRFRKLFGSVISVNLKSAALRNMNVFLTPGSV